jgi:hypothetical protein
MSNRFSVRFRDKPIYLEEDFIGKEKDYYFIRFGLINELMWYCDSLYYPSLKEMLFNDNTVILK